MEKMSTPSPPPPSIPRTCPIIHQLAVSFLHYDEIRVFDLELILPNAEAVPVLTLVPDGVRGRHGSNGGGAFRERSRSVGAFASGRRNAGNAVS